MLFDGFKFVLWEKLKKVDVKGWIMLAAALVLAVVLIIYLVQRRKRAKQAGGTGETELKSEAPNAPAKPLIILVHGALCIAMSFVLSYFKLFSMPTGGSVTLASMLPLMVYSNRYGVKYGLVAGVVYGILQYIQKPEMFHWVQMLIDYPIAFGLIGLGGLVKGEKNLVFSVLIGGTARFLAHLVSGILCFGEYVMIGSNAANMTFGAMFGPNFIVSLTYNAPYMFADIAICAVIALLPPFRKAIKTALKY